MVKLYAQTVPMKQLKIVHQNVALRSVFDVVTVHVLMKSNAVSTRTYFMEKKKKLEK